MSDQDKMQDVCAICHRTEDTAGKMVAMPNGMKVCTDCMNRMMQAASQLDFSSMFQNMGSFPSMEEWMKAMTTQPGPETSVTESGESLPEKKDTTAVTGSEDNPQEPGEPDEKEKDGKEESSGGKRPGVTFLNLGDLFGGGPFMGQQQKAPKKKKKERNQPPLFFI